MADYFGVNSYSQSGFDLGSFSAPQTQSSVGAYTSGGGSMFGGMTAGSALGIGSALAGAFSSIMGANANADAIKAKSKATIAQIGRETDTFRFEADVVEQQRAEASRELGDMMSDVGLQALEAEAKVRAINASRGVSGSTVQQQSTNVAMKANLANAELIKKYENTDVTLLRRKLAAQVSMRNKVASLAGGTYGGGNSLIASGLAGAFGGLQSSLSFMSDTDKSALYNKIFN